MAQTKITKAHIICHLLATNGPMTKSELLRQTAIIEGKPYRPNSNGSYFMPVVNIDLGYRRGDDYEKLRKASLVANGTIKVVGKIGRELTYDLDAKGFMKVEEYKQLVGL